MNFGVRLPGPFRVGISDKGRLNVGATLGPLSVSTGVGQTRRRAEVTAPVHLLDALADLLDHGWKIRGRRDDWALVTKGWKALELRTIPGGVAARRVTSRRTILTWAVTVVGLVLVLYYA